MNIVLFYAMTKYELNIYNIYSHECNILFIMGPV